MSKGDREMNCKTDTKWNFYLSSRLSQFPGYLAQRSKGIRASQMSKELLLDNAQN